MLCNLGVLATVTTLAVPVQSQAVLNGVDGRQDTAAKSSTWTAPALMWAHRLTFLNDGVELRAPTAEAAYDLCTQQPFGIQPAAAFCSGVLIGKARVLTAAHCLGDTLAAARDRCRRAWVVFGYAAPDARGTVHIGDDDVFACRDVVTFEHEAHDVAIITLDRDVPSTWTPWAVASARVTAGDEFDVYSYGAGLPLKIERGAVVTGGVVSGDNDAFEAAADTFSGSSGGGAVNAQGRLVGMALRGQSDWQVAGLCQVAATSAVPREVFQHADALVDVSCAKANVRGGFCGTTPLCGDGVCDDDESKLTCAQDCRPALCSDGLCEPSERRTCAADCARFLTVPPSWLDDPQLYNNATMTDGASGCSLASKPLNLGTGSFVLVALLVCVSRAASRWARHTEARRSA